MSTCRAGRAAGRHLSRLSADVRLRPVDAGVEEQWIGAELLGGREQTCAVVLDGAAIEGQGCSPFETLPRNLDLE